VRVARRHARNTHAGRTDGTDEAEERERERDGGGARARENDGAAYSTEMEHTRSFASARTLRPEARVQSRSARHTLSR